MKNVLFIVYYFPPMGGSGVQRPLKFTKYLREFGWNPIILCPEPGVYHTFDESLQEELDSLDLETHKVHGGGFFQKISGSKSQKELKINDSTAKRLRRLSRLFFYPDNKKGWIKPAFKKGMEIISNQKIDLIFSTAPPFSNHILAQQLKEASGLPLVIDYRDSWTNNHFQTEMWNWQKQILRNQERNVVATADKVICLDNFIRSDFILNYPEIADRVEVIPHGFDSDDFNTVEESGINYKTGALNILYSGLFYEQNQPDFFLQAINQLLIERLVSKHEIKLHFQGGLDPRIRRLIKDLELEEITSVYGYLPHKQAVINILKADLLWMISNFDPELKQIKSGKLFEYFGTGKPILGLIHKSEASELLEKYGASFSANPTNLSDIKEQLSTIFHRWRSKTMPSASQDFIAQFDRKLLTKKLAQIFNVIS